MFYKVSLSLLLTAFIGGSVNAETSRLEKVLSSITEDVAVTEVDEEVDESVPVVQPVPVPDLPPRWVGENFNQNESKALEFFQDYGITDRMALAVLLGNIRQESNFHSNICEGGARVNYEHCRS